jgi:hypothetical protein
MIVEKRRRDNDITSYLRFLFNHKLYHILKILMTFSIEEK